ncbi:MAG TPA: bifunctional (p)ppGpp synthetase/guanosine-3',5'-bis(diphosphate) 3'-pyrophosphohydrolase [Syntrophorhabdaceae bacterium]|nr:bifunctional (p)ppGpp synthetase/guanosine-3',5'-bis(diphosphate) 3'-pyrophosphohydrolase [Syntrophorhabdaceae bacterium]
MIRFNDIVDEVLKYNPQADVELLQRAYVFSAKAHKGQTRLSGEPYLIHPLEVAYTLTRMNLDISSIASGLLHDTVEDSYVDKKEIEEYFGKEIAELVDGVTKISKIPLKTSEDSRVENFRKMILAMSKDIRVILIKLADRYHNMQTLNFLSPDKQVEIARETLDIYAPLAHRLGIEWLRGELEDVSFKYLKPAEYRLIAENIAQKRKQREEYIGEVIALLRQRFDLYHLQAEISGRAKRLYSIYRKMVQEGINVDDIYDITAFRVIVNDIKECYEALGLIHSFFKPIPGKFSDYIALPKGNMYQSLHTKVIGPHGEKIEIQIRTREMHKIAEEGIAAHWKYKEGKVFNPKEDRIFAWLRRIIEWQQELKDNKEFMEIFKIDLFPDEVYVFTPKGDVRELPKGATPVDLAYAIHSDLGHRCVGAKVNGKIVPLRYLLKSGDTVEILTNPSHRPSKDWLNFVTTSKAKTKIRQWIKTEQRERSIELGRTLVEKELAKHDINFNKFLKSPELQTITKDFGFETVEDLFAGVGYGLYTPLQVLSKVIPETEKASGIKHIIKTISRSKDNAIKVQGVDSLVVRFGKCCNPIPGDKIVGFITRGRGLTIHVEDCPNIHTYDEQRKIDVSWQLTKDFTYPVRLKVVGSDRKGLLSDISTTIASNKINIVSAQATAYPDRSAAGLYEVEIAHTGQLQKVIKSIQKIKGVRSVERVRGGSP